ncbi:hypothetical protein [Spirochaeta dissipatitropha]
MIRTAARILLIMLALPMSISSRDIFINYTEKESIIYPQYTWLDGTGTDSVKGLVLAPGRELRLLEVSRTDSMDISSFGAGTVAPQYEVRGIHMISHSIGDLALVHITSRNNAGIFIIEIEKIREGLYKNHVFSSEDCILNMTVSERFSDWHADIDSQGILYLIRPDRGAIRQSAKALYLHRFSPDFRLIDESIQIYHTEGYLLQPRIVFQNDQKYVFWREGQRTDQGFISAGIISDGLLRVVCSMDADFNFPLNSSLPPDLFFEQVSRRDPGMQVITISDSQVQLLYQHIPVQQSELTQFQTGLRLLTLRFENEIVMAASVHQIAAARTGQILYPGTALSQDTSLLIPFSKHSRQGQEAFYLEFDQDAAPGPDNYSRLLQSPRNQSLPFFFRTPARPAALFFSRIPDHAYTLAIHPSPLAVSGGIESSISSLFVFHYGNRIESLTSSLLTFLAAIMLSILAGSLAAFPGLLVFWLLLAILNVFHPQSLYLKRGSLAAAGMLIILACAWLPDAIPMELLPGSIVFRYILICLILTGAVTSARHQLAGSRGYSGLLRIVWLHTVLLTGFTTWPALFLFLSDWFLP